MKNITNSNRWRLGLLALGCAAGPLLPQPLSAEVSDADFKALRELVQQLNDQVQALRQTNQLVQQQHVQDVQQLQELQAKLAETQQTAAEK